jgi:hypothetical protein
VHEREIRIDLQGTSKNRTRFWHTTSVEQEISQIGLVDGIQRITLVGPRLHRD